MSHHGWTDALPTHVCRHVYNPGTTTRPKGRAGCPPRTRAAAHFSQVALALARFFAQIHHISARGFGGHGDLGEVLLVVAEEHGEEHLPRERQQLSASIPVPRVPVQVRMCWQPSPPPRPPRHTACRAPGVPGVRSNRLTQKAKPSLSVTLSVICLSWTHMVRGVCPTRPGNRAAHQSRGQSGHHTCAGSLEGDLERDTYRSRGGEGKQEAEHGGKSSIYTTRVYHLLKPLCFWGENVLIKSNAYVTA